jgi:DNA-binding MarR family transcriptional regulator
LLSKLSREERVEAFIAAIRASQTATQMLDATIAEYLGLHGTDYRALDVLDQEGPMTAGRLAERARLSPGATTALIDRLEQKGLARRIRDTEDRRRVLVEVTPSVREQAARLYGTPEGIAAGLAHLTDEQLDFLTEFHRGSVAYQHELLARFEAMKEEG